jgi:hypothetical protein
MARVLFPVQWVVGALCLWCEADPSTPFVFWCLIEHRHNFTWTGCPLEIMHPWLRGQLVTVKLLGMLNWRRLIGFSYIISMTKFSEYKVTQEKHEGFNHIVKATEALCETGPCLPFTRNMVFVVLRCSAFICNLKIPSYRTVFQSNLLASSYFQSLVLGARSLYGVQ